MRAMTWTTLISILGLSLLPGALGIAGLRADTLIVLNKAEATASLIDLATGKVAATLPTGPGPHEVAVSPDGRRALVANYGGRTPGNTLTLIQVPKARVVKTIDLGEHRRPHGVHWLAGDRVLVTAEANQALLTVDVAAGTVVRAVPTDQRVSHMVVATPDGARAFAANIGSGSVTVIDLKKGKRIRNIPTGAGAEGIDVTPDGKQVWITNRAEDTVTVLDATSLKVLATVPSAAFPIRAKVTPDGRHVLVSNARSGEVAVFDAATRREVRRIPMEHRAADGEGRLFGGQFGDSPVPIGILIAPDGRRAYVANANADVIAVVDLTEWRVTGTLTAGREPDGLGFSPHSVKSPAVAPETGKRPGAGGRGARPAAQRTSPGERSAGRPPDRTRAGAARVLPVSWAATKSP